MCAITEAYDTMLYLPIMSDKAVNKGSECFELGWQPHEFLNSKYLFFSGNRHFLIIAPIDFRIFIRLDSLSSHGQM